MPFFQVNNISKAFGGLKALNQLSFAVNKHEIYSIIGPNGAGKSTIFNCINGLYTPEEGEIVIDDRVITGMRPHNIARCGIARTFQNLELFSHMTTLDNLLLGRHLKMNASIFSIFNLGFRWSNSAREEIRHRYRVEEIIDFLDLQAYRNRPIFSLPYGIQKLIELGRALAMEPSLLLLDEPAAGLNNEERHDMIGWIKDIRQDLGITIIVIEHNMKLVKDISDRVLAINFGVKLSEGTVDAVLQQDDVIQAYLGDKI